MWAKFTACVVVYCGRKMLWAMARARLGAFTCRRPLSHRCRRCPGRWLRCWQHPEEGRPRCPGDLWERRFGQHPGSGRRSRKTHPPQQGAGAWATETGSLVELVLCSKRRCCLLWRRTRKRSGSQCGQCAAYGTHSANIHLVLAVYWQHRGLDACKSHWSRKQNTTFRLDTMKTC